MKTQIAFKVAVVSAMAIALPTAAQTFSGTNAPNTGTNFSFTVGAGATNLSLVISNSATAYSHLYLKRGGPAATNDFDFVARLNGQTNQINLELPEFAVTSYGLRVVTPATSLQHAFNVVLTTNAPGLRNPLPALKPVVFSTTGSLVNGGSGAWNYFQVDVPTNLTSGWRIVLTYTGSGNPDLYVRRSNVPSTGVFDKSSTGQSMETIVFNNTEATSGTYFIGVYLPSGPSSACTYALSTELGYVKTLTWDPGTTHDGTQVFTNTSGTGGDYYFKITTLGTTVGGWRTALKVLSGDADIFLRKDTFATGTGNYTFKQSTRVGSDGFVLGDTEFAAGQDWYLLVRATPGAQWTLVSGEAYVLNLGNVAPAGSSATSTNVTIGPEGLRFFKMIPPAGTLAWRLGLNGATNNILVRKTVVPVPLNVNTYDLRQASQMLVVPAYLNGGDTYYVAVPGNPGDAVNLDNRQQTITTVPFSSSTPLTVSGYGYTTFQIDVPVQQIAWAIELNTTSGDGNVAVRRSSIPNEWNNDAFSEVPGLAREQILLVPPTLSDGAFYVTVYGTNAFTCTLTSGNPTITDVPFAGLTTNNVPTLIGWRLYRVPDINSQLGFIGWDLFLSNQPPNTEIALRRNAVPGRWNYRSGSSTIFSQGNVDYSSTAGFLQRQDHQADIWYIGVYNPAAPLNAFTLDRRTYSTDTVELATNAAPVVNQPANQLRYFRMDVPAGVLGWDVRITNVTSGDPRLVVRRDRLPDNLSSHYNGGGGWGASSGTSWGSGDQWAAGSDWTAYSQSPLGTNESGRILAMGMGSPLQPGTYYIGVTGPGTVTNALSYSISSRLIGSGQPIQISPLAFNGGSVTLSNLVPREPSYFSVNVPTNTESWRVNLAATVGESLFCIQKDTPPNVGAGAYNSPYAISGGAKVTKLGDESYLMLPTSGETNIPSGTYYLGVVSEGMNPSGNHIGTNVSVATLQSVATLPVLDLGTLGGSDIVQPDTFASADVKAYRFTLPAGLLAVEVRLENRVGNPQMSLRAGTNLPWPVDSYGSIGGQTPISYDPNLIYMANPSNGVYTLVVQATALSGAYPAASCNIRIHALGSSPFAFDGGSTNVVAQPADTWRYFSVTVPPGAAGWDLRIQNVTSGDPRLVVRRGTAPSSLSTLVSGGTGWSVAGATSWPSNYQWGAAYDLTGYSQDADGTNQIGHVLHMGMGNPLEPGDYIVGVAAGGGTGSANPMSYTLVSRGIGTGFTIPITPLAFTGTNVLSNLQPRSVAYFQVDIPSNSPNWKISLSTNTGDSLLVIQRGIIPNVAAAASAPTTLNGGRVVKKTGDEYYRLLPDANQSNILAGTYYLAVVSEGVGPTSSRAGTNTSSATLVSAGAISHLNLGTLTPGVDLTQPGSLRGGDLQMFQFNVAAGVLSMQLRLTNRVGNPRMTLRRGPLTPYPVETYGNDGGTTYEWQDPAFIDIPNPTPGLYTLTVQAASSGGYPDATFTVLLQASGSTPLAFDNGVVNVTNQASGTWKYFYLTVPSNAAGWDLRITNVTSGDPRLVVRREQLPTSLSTLTSSGGGWSVASATSWPTGYQWAAYSDWTGYSTGADGTNESGHILAMGMGNPLEPGNYYIGVLNSSGSGYLDPMSYTLVSRGIGAGFAIATNTLAPNGLVVNAALPVRETDYYRVTIPNNTPSWKLRLIPNAGQVVLSVNRAALPNVVAANYYNATAGTSGHLMQKVGDELYLLLPANGQTNIPAGDYFVGVSSEGLYPTSTRAGSNSVSYTLTSLSPFPVQDLGAIGASDILVTNTLQGGDNKAFQFTIAPGTTAVDLRLENRVGNPRMMLRRGAGIPMPYDGYGNDGGQNYNWNDTAVITLANTVATNYTLNIQATLSGSAYPDASYVLRIHPAQITNLNFAANLNTNGLSNANSGVLSDNQRAFYRIQVPATNNGRAVLGWKLDLAQAFGAASLRVRKNILPSDDDTGQMPFTPDEAVIVPPFLTPGTWYVEVKATGTTGFTLTSSDINLERPAWLMPQFGQLPTTPGVTPPDFGDTGVQTNGTPLPGDQGIDLNQGGLHYYAVEVPQFNGGIVRVLLEAISGNPDFYMRQAALPTITHNTSGTPGSIYDRVLNATGTEYANWVAADNRYSNSLPTGTWYIAVRAAGNSNARYRLHVSTGNMQDIPLHGANLTGQIVAAKDFRYYRVVVPTNAPTAWSFSFNQQIGDVFVYVRDTVPPGQNTTVTDFIDWSNDNKNHGPYPTFDASGTYTINTPPLRPGHVYYLGFRGVVDSTFTLTTSTNGTSINVAGVLPFYGGGVTNVVLPALSKTTYRIDVPAEATRLRQTNAGPATVKFYLDQGSMPTVTSSDHWNGSGNVLLNQTLGQAAGWPWVPAQMYFLTVTNTSASSQTFTIGLDGRNCATDDNDNDGMPDCWEIAWFGDTSQSASGDADHDGVSNLQEYLDGTSPIDPTSMLARLTITTNGPGSVLVSPNQPTYPYGTTATLTAVPAANNILVNWTGPGITNTSNPFPLSMTTNRYITANFAYDYGAPGVTRADYRFQNTLASSVGTPPDLSLISTGQYFTNITVDGTSRTVLRFLQGKSLQLVPTTPVFGSNVYTVVILFRFDTVASWRRLLDLKNAVGDQGLYVQDGRLNIYPASQVSGICITNDTWHQVVVTRDASGIVNIYSDGTLRLTYNDAGTGYLTVSSAAAMRFFKDEGAVEESAGYVARIRNFATALSASEVIALDREPGSFVGPFILSSAKVNGQNQFYFTINGPAGIACSIQSSTNLLNWTTLSNITSFPGSMNYTSPATGRAQFFRVKQ
jgi:hypothetical protein